MEKDHVHLVFVCVSNRGRSVFAEFFFRKLLSELNDGRCNMVRVTSAGYIPQAIKDQMAELHIRFPEPFYDRPMAETTRTFLWERGIVVPPGWRSRGLTPEMVKNADLIITALPQQEEDLLSLYPDAGAKISTFRKISGWEEPFTFEDLTGLPKDNSYWNYVEEDVDYVNTILSEVERSLIQAFPQILSRLGCGQ
jgi:protein-tyrosine-phosphatase